MGLDLDVMIQNVPKIVVPELIRMKEFYGNSVKSHVDKCPTVISIPSNAIRSVSTSQVSQARYTFVRADNGEEVNTFRPRQIADETRSILYPVSSRTLFMGFHPLFRLNCRRRSGLSVRALAPH